MPQTSKRSLLSHEWLLEHYVDKHFTCSEIAAIARLSVSQVWKRIHECDIQLRHRGESIKRGRRLSAEHREKLSQAKLGKPGHKWSVERKREMSALQKGKQLSAEHIAKLKAAIRPPATEEHRRKLSVSLTGRIFSVIHRQKLSAAMRLKSPSDETRQKMSASQKARIAREGHTLKPEVGALGRLAHSKAVGTFGLSTEQLRHRRQLVAFLRFCLNRLGIVSTCRDRSCEQLVGYTKAQLRDHIQRQFSDGMTWANYGRGHDKWCIDHRRPVIDFVRNGITDAAVVNALGNLQPMWNRDNQVKHDKIA
jgi:hypothetical protein